MEEKVNGVANNVFLNLSHNPLHERYFPLVITQPIKFLSFLSHSTLKLLQKIKIRI